MKNLQGEKIGEYDYNYRYRDTHITHRIEEFFDPARKIRFVLLKKETRKGESFVRLPSSLWVTCPGYPPLVTDSGVRSLPGQKQSSFFAGLPTIKSEEHIRAFDNYLKEHLAPLGVDYEQCSKKLKEREIAKKMGMTGFMYASQELFDEEKVLRFLDVVCKAYEQVLNCEACECDVRKWTEWIIGEQAVNEYHLFKEWGFDVPVSGQRAFFTMMMDEREP
jgi:hypothetical protein